MPRATTAAVEAALAKGGVSAALAMLQPSQSKTNTNGGTTSAEAPDKLKRSRENLQDNAGAEKPVQKKAMHSITLSGGAVQPPRVIGYKRTNANVDINVRVERRSFPAHSKVLASSCGFFEKLVASGDFDYKRPVELPTGSAQAYEAMLEFFYLGECTFPESLLEKVLETAYYLKAQIPMRGTLAAFTAKLTPNNCLYGLQVAHRISCMQLRRAAQQMVRAHFDQVRTHASFTSLPEEALCAIVADDALGVTEERSAFEAITLWIDAQKPSLSASKVAELLRLVRYPTMPRSYLVERVMAHPLVQQLPGGPASLLLPYFLDAHYGPSSWRSTPRLGVEPLVLPMESTGSFPDQASNGDQRRSSDGRRRADERGERPAAWLSSDGN